MSIPSPANASFLVTYVSVETSGVKEGLAFSENSQVSKMDGPPIIRKPTWAIDNGLNHMLQQIWGKGLFVIGDCDVVDGMQGNASPSSRK